MSSKNRFADLASSTLVALAALALFVGVMLAPNVVLADDAVVQPNCITPISDAQNATPSSSICFTTTCTGTDCAKCVPLNGGCTGGCGASNGNCLDNNGVVCGCGMPAGYTACTCTY